MILGHIILIISFLLGLSIDFFSDSGGINAAATLFIAYIRLPILSAILRKNEFDFLNNLFMFSTFLCVITL